QPVLARLGRVEARHQRPGDGAREDDHDEAVRADQVAAPGRRHGEAGEAEESENDQRELAFGPCQSRYHDAIPPPPAVPGKTRLSAKTGILNTSFSSKDLRSQEESALRNPLFVASPDDRPAGRARRCFADGKGCAFLS